MQIKTRMGVSVDGFVDTPEGMPLLATMAGFEGGRSYDYDPFIEGCDAAVMGRATFDLAEGADWPWPRLEVHVLTSSPLGAWAPADVVTVGDPVQMLDRLSSRPSGGDVHLIGGPQTIRTFIDLGALDRLEILRLPILAGTGTVLWPAGSPPRRLQLVRADRSYADGTCEVVYQLE
jgi:dihydrofolate reductase